MGGRCTTSLPTRAGQAPATAPAPPSGRRSRRSGSRARAAASPPLCSARPSAQTARSRSPTADTRSTTTSQTPSAARRQARGSTSSVLPGGSSQLPARKFTVARKQRTWLEVVGEIARYLGAVSLLMVAAIPAQQYYDAYFSAVPVIGRLFLLNIVGAGVTGLLLLAPVRLLGRRAGGAILVPTALGGIGVAAGAFAALLVSEYTPLFGFMESGYRLAIHLSLLFEGLATLLLAAFIVTLVLGRRQAVRADRNSRVVAGRRQPAAL